MILTMRYKADLIFLFKAFSRVDHGIHILDILGKPNCCITEEMEYFSGYTSETFKELYFNKDIKKIKKKKVLVLCAEYPEKLKNNYEDLAKYFPLRYASISNVRAVNGDFLVKLKLGSLIRFKFASVDEYTSQIRKNVGDTNLPLWYKCGPNFDQTQFLVATIGKKEFIEELNNISILNQWEFKVNELFDKIEKSKNYIFYYIESIMKDNSTKNLLKCKVLRSIKKIHLISNTKYNIHLRLLLNEDNKWKIKNNSDQPYISLISQKDSIVPTQNKEYIRTDTSRSIPIDLKFRTGEKSQKGDIIIKFGPEKDDELKKTRISIPFSISRRGKYSLFLLFISFIAFDVLGNMILNLNQDLSLDLQFFLNLLITIGIIGSFILLYRKRII